MSRTARFVLISFLVMNLSGCAIGGALFKAIFLRSGAPPGGEMRRMEEREAVFLSELPETGILVLPMAILNKDVTYRPRLAELLASRLRDAGFPGARTGLTTYALPFPKQPNQAWLYWKRFRALGEAVKEAPPGGGAPSDSVGEVDYVLLVDIMGSTNDDGTLRGVGGVHAYVTNIQGDLVYGRLRNAMHSVWKEIDPRSFADICDMVVEDLVNSRQEAPEG